jgi:alpha-L-fucosidase
MRYITLTARHHDGFSLYDTRGLSNFDAMQSPAKRDLIGEFVRACREEGILPVLYHTTLDWYETSYRTDFNAYLEYLRKSVELLCTHYGPIGGLWFDGNWDRPDSDWKLDELYGMIRRLQPEALIINNTGLNKRGELGHREIDSVTYEQGRPKPMDRSGMEKYVAAEMCETMNDHWGIGSGDFMYKSVPQLIESLCACRKAGANYLLNVGPTAQGRIPKMQEAMLELMGDWLRLNGTAFYEGKPSAIEGEGSNFALETENGKLYLFIHHLKISGHANVTVDGGGAGEKRFTGLHRHVSSVRWLDNGEPLEFDQDASSGYFRFVATGFPYGVNYVVRVAEVQLARSLN